MAGLAPAGGADHVAKLYISGKTPPRCIRKSNQINAALRPACLLHFCNGWRAPSPADQRRSHTSDERKTVEQGQKP
jgi:hypothetical protein